MKGRRWLILIGVVLSVLACWAFWWEPASLRLERRTLILEGWPVECSGLRIALLADLHVGSPFNGTGKLTLIVERTLAAEPDMILLLGDYVIQGVMGGSFVSPEESAAILSGLEAPAGVFAVLGNHDWWLDAGRVEAAMRQRGGIAVLEDSAVATGAADCGLWVAGVSDYWEGAHDVERALSQVPPDAPVIAFTHNPDIFPDVPASVDLTVAGHTHGGQVSFPLVGPLIVPSDFGDRYAAGLITEHGRPLYVTTGTGTSILPVRFRVAPEVVVLTLTAPGRTGAEARVP